MKDWKAKLQAALTAYGPVALGVWFVIFGLTWGGFALVIGTGFEVDGVAGSAGTVGAAYLATQATKPLRVVATLAFTPVVARLLGRSPVGLEARPGDAAAEMEEGG